MTSDERILGGPFRVLAGATLDTTIALFGRRAPTPGALFPFQRWLRVGVVPAGVDADRWLSSCVFTLVFGERPDLVPLRTLHDILEPSSVLVVLDDPRKTEVRVRSLCSADIELEMRIA